MSYEKRKKALIILFSDNLNKPFVKNQLYFNNNIDQKEFDDILNKCKISMHHTLYEQPNEFNKIMPIVAKIKQLDEILLDFIADKNYKTNIKTEQQMLIKQLEQIMTTSYIHWKKLDKKTFEWIKLKIKGQY